MKKKFKKLLGVLLGLSIVTAMAATSAADGASGAFNRPAGGVMEDNDDIAEETGGTYFSCPYADENEADKLCPEGYERVPSDNGLKFKAKVTETSDLSALTPIEHNEYVDGDFYIVDEVYEQAGVPTDLYIINASEWEYKRVTVNRSIYQDPDKNHGTLLATMTVTVQFKWNGNTAWVVGDPYCNTKIEPAGQEFIKSKSNKEVAFASDQGSNFLFGNKYAYVEYIVTLTYHFGVSGLPDELPVDFRLYVSVNRNGSMNTEK